MKTTVKKWIELSRLRVFQKFSRKIDKVIFQLPNQTQSDIYVKSENNTVSILALTPDKKVILVKQFRPGPKQVLTEIPGGFLQNGDDPKTKAAEELLEETGFKGNLQFVTTCLDDAYSTMIRYCFVATDCIRTGGIDNTLHDNDGQNKGFSEIKEVVTIPLTKFKKLLNSGQITDVEVGFLGLNYLGLL